MLSRIVRLLVLGLAGALVALTLLAGAGARPAGNGSYGGTLTVGLTHGYPDSLDPTTDVSFSSVVISLPLSGRE